jgi:hypothetical protein
MKITKSDKLVISIAVVICIIGMAFIITREPEVNNRPRTVLNQAERVNDVQWKISILDEGKVFQQLCYHNVQLIRNNTIEIEQPTTDGLIKNVTLGKRIVELKYEDSNSDDKYSIGDYFTITYSGIAAPPSGVKWELKLLFNADNSFITSVNFTT